jgi:hypothetical protein
LQHVKAAAEQFKDMDRWACLLRYISNRIAPVIGPPRLAQALPATGCERRPETASKQPV